MPVSIKSAIMITARQLIPKVINYNNAGVSFQITLPFIWLMPIPLITSLYFDFESH